MELVAARFGHEANLRAGKLAIIARIRVGNDGGFLNFVGARVRLVAPVLLMLMTRCVLTVDREKVRRGRHTVHGEIAIATAVADDNARSRVSDVGDVTAGAGEFLNFHVVKAVFVLDSVLTSGAASDTSTVCVEEPTSRVRSAVFAWPRLNVNRTLGLLETCRGCDHRVVAGFQEREAIFAGLIRFGGLTRTGIEALPESPKRLE